MALTERSRSALYTGLRTVVDEEAVQEMLSFFPARDVEEPVTKDHLRAEMAELRAEITDLRTDLRAEIAEHGDAIRRDLRSEMHRIAVLNVGTFVAFGALLIAAIRL